MTLAAVVGASKHAAPAPAATASLPAVIPAVGKTLHYRVTRTAQGNTGARVATSIVTLHRKSATTATLKGVFDQPSVLTQLTVGVDGLLEIPEKDKPSKEDASLSDIVNGLNRLTGLFAGKSSAPPNGWNANLRLPDLRGTSSPVLIPIAVVAANAAGFELHGVGELNVAAEVSRTAGQIAQPGQIYGPPRGFENPSRFRPGNGFAGDALPGAVLAGGAPAGRQAFSVAVSVDGRIRHGTISRIAIVETRSITFDALPFVNVSGWTIETTK